MNNMRNRCAARLIAPMCLCLSLAGASAHSGRAAKRRDVPLTPLTREQLNTKVPHFYCFVYDADPQPGKRYWLRLSDTTWIERYPDGQESTFKVLGHEFVTHLTQASSLQ